MLTEMVAAFNRRDLDEWLANFSPEVEWDMTEGFLGVQDVYRGLAGTRKWWDDFLAVWQTFELGIDEIMEGENGGVVVGIPGTGRGLASGVETELHFVCAFWLADNSKVVRARIFQERAAALEAVGLSEQENVEIVLTHVRRLEPPGRGGVAGARRPRGRVRQLPDGNRAGNEARYERGSGRRRTQWEFLRDGRIEIDRTYDRGEEIFALRRVSRLMPEGETRIEDRALAS